MSILRVIASSALALSCAGACMAPEPPPEPFHTGPYGPGLEVNLPGDKVQVLDGDDAVRYNLRIGDSALRIYSATSVRLGSAAIRDGQLTISSRDGSEVCTALEQGANSVVVACGDAATVSAVYDDGTWTFSGEGGHDFSVSTSGDSIQWQSLVSDDSASIEMTAQTVTLANERGTLSQLVGRARVPQKERALLLAAGHSLTDSASDIDAIAWFSAAWIVLQTTTDQSEATP